MDIKLVALLPMKGNSERIPGKNYKLLSGKPLFYYVCDTLRNTGAFESLVINTDSPIISEMARERYGDWVIVHDRPAELCGDMVSMYKINEYDVSRIGDSVHFFQTHSTNPFLSESTIIDSIQAYKSNLNMGTHDSLFSVTEIRSRLYHSNGEPINHDPSVLLRSQDNMPVYEENSNIYIFSHDTFNVTKKRLGRNPFQFVIHSDEFESLDIDNVIEWKLAEFVLSSK